MQSGHAYGYGEALLELECYYCASATQWTLCTIDVWSQGQLQLAYL